MELLTIPLTLALSPPRLVRPFSFPVSFHSPFSLYIYHPDDPFPAVAGIAKLDNVTGSNPNDYFGASAVDPSSKLFFLQTGDVFNKRIVAVNANVGGGVFKQKVLGATPDGDVIGAFVSLPKQ